MWLWSPPPSGLQPEQAVSILYIQDLHKMLFEEKKHDRLKTGLKITVSLSMFSVTRKEFSNDACRMSRRCFPQNIF